MFDLLKKTAQSKQDNDSGDKLSDDDEKYIKDIEEALEEYLSEVDDDDDSMEDLEEISKAIKQWRTGAKFDDWEDEEVTEEMEPVKDGPSRDPEDPMDLLKKLW